MAAGSGEAGCWAAAGADDAGCWAAAGCWAVTTAGATVGFEERAAEAAEARAPDAALAAVRAAAAEPGPFEAGVAAGADEAGSGADMGRAEAGAVTGRAGCPASAVSECCPDEAAGAKPNAATIDMTAAASTVRVSAMIGSPIGDSATRSIPSYPSWTPRASARFALPSNSSRARSMNTCMCGAIHLFRWRSSCSSISTGGKPAASSRSVPAANWAAAAKRGTNATPTPSSAICTSVSVLPASTTGSRRRPAAASVRSSSSR